MQNQRGNQRTMYSTPCPLDISVRSFTTSMLHMPTVILRMLKIQDHKQHCINCNHGPLRDLVFSERTTPLIVACQYGELETVKIIVEDWGANVEATGVYYRDPKQVLTTEKIDRASPLFVAASCGHFDIVRYLVEKGADVTATTISNSKPQYHGLASLLGAFFAHFDSKSTATGFHKKLTDIVMILLEAGADPSALPFDGTPIWPLYGCRVEPALITALIHHGLDLNQRFTSPTPSDYARSIILFFTSSLAQLHHFIKKMFPLASSSCRWKSAPIHSSRMMTVLHLSSEQPTVRMAVVPT